MPLMVGGEEIVIGFSVEDNGATEKIQEINSQLKETQGAGESAASGTQEASDSMQELDATIKNAERALVLIQEAYKNTVGVALEYADQVRQLSQISGESTENTSRFIQVLDDYKISTDDALTATRTLTKNGFTPSIDSLAKLSDEYLALNTAQDRNDFILKNLGRSGLGWVEVLQKGSAAIKEQGAAVSENLVLTQKMVDAAREHEIALDNWNDTVKGASITFGNELLPVLTKGVDFFTRGARAAEIFYGALFDGKDGIVSYFGALKQADDEIQASKDALMAQADAADTAAQSQKDYEEQIKAVSDANKALVDSAIAITEETQKYQDQQDSIKNQISELQAQKDGYYSWEVDKIQATQDKIDELSQKYDDNAQAFTDAMNKKFAMMAIEKIAMSDGVAGYSDAEYQKAKAILETTDVATAAAFDQAQAQEILTSAVADGKISVTEFGDVMKTVMADGVVSVDEVNAALKALPKDTDLNVNIHTSGLDTLYAAYGDSARTTGTAPNGNRRAAGGAVMAGVPYTVGEFGQETFIPSQNGSIMPNNRGSFNDVVAAIYATKPDYSEFARVLASLVQQGIK